MKEIDWMSQFATLWKDLHSKEVRVIVTEDSGVQVVTLYESKTGNYYIVAVNGEEK
jgi:hypothetical protein